MGNVPLVVQSSLMFVPAALIDSLMRGGDEGRATVVGVDDDVVGDEIKVKKEGLLQKMKRQREASCNIGLGW